MEFDIGVTYERDLDLVNFLSLNPPSTSSPSSIGFESGNIPPPVVVLTLAAVPCPTPSNPTQHE